MRSAGSRRIAADAVIMLLIGLSWLLVFFLPLNGDHHEFTGQPLQYALLAINASVIIVALLAGRNQLSKRTIPIMLGLLLLDVLLGKYFWQAVSWLVGQFSQEIMVMIYLDTIGCVAVAILFGSRLGVATAAAYYLILAIWDPGMLLFSALNMTVAFCAGKFRELGGMSSIFTAGISGLFVGLLTALMAAPVNLKVFGPIIESGQNPTALLFNEIKYSTVGLFEGFGGSDPLDKMITFILAHLLSVKVASRCAAIKT